MAFSIGGNASRSGSSTSSESTTTGTNRVVGTTKSVSELLAGDANSKATLDNIMAELFGASVDSLKKPGTVDPGYTKQDAIADSQGLVDSIFRQFRSTSLPQIYAAQGSAGAYNSTGAQLMANDAYADTVSKAQSAVLGNIKSYADITAQMKAAGTDETNSRVGALLSALGLQQDATKKQTGTENVDQTTNFTSSTKSFSKTKGKSAGIGGSFSGETL